MKSHYITGFDLFFL